MSMSCRCCGAMCSFTVPSLPEAVLPENSTACAVFLCLDFGPILSVANFATKTDVMLTKVETETFKHEHP